MIIESILTLVPAVVLVALGVVLAYSAAHALRCVVARLQNTPCPQ
ncbi:MAG: hypothetical protein Q9O24_07240 [Gammaproteobacteria bacterium]|nr:hypothetical protein [Gammaproteobacteria bacterium]